jgi:hypothetical protein
MVRAEISPDVGSYYDTTNVKAEYMPIFNEEGLNACANKVPKPCYNSWDHVNGCGSDNPLDPVPDNPTGCEHTSFLNPCNWHDACYGTCGGFGGAGKYNCDAGFGGQMQGVCNALTGQERDDCFDNCWWWANTYAVAVYIIGQEYYTNGQIQGCVCGDCQ